jgi:hypothetical protein
LSSAFRDLVSEQPFTPDTSAIKARARRARQRRRIVRSGVGLGVVAVAAVTAAGVASGAHPARTGTPAQAASGGHPARSSATGSTGSTDKGSTGSTATQAQAPGSQQTLVTLAAHLAAAPQPAGDATLMERVTVSRGYPTVKVWDLYADDGRYFFSPTEAGLPAQVKADNNQGNGQFGLETAAAVYAVTGNLDTAALKMAWPSKAPMPAALKEEARYLSAPTAGNVAQLYNRIWIDCEDALVAGSGNPQVRAGVLRLVSILPGVTVTHGTDDGQPALTVNAGPAEFENSTTTTGDNTQPPFQDAITVNADTGVPLKDVSGPAGGPPTIVTYTVTRVNLAAIASGKF